MPPVTVLDHILATNAATVEGYVGLVAVGNLQFFGSILAAQAVLCTDDAMLRSILVHEFAHCFDRMRRFYDHLDSGAQDVLYLPGGTDEAQENAALANPADWFGDDDVQSFVRWGHLGATIHTRLSEHRLTSHLKVVWIDPDNPFEGNIALAIPPEIVDHIRRLRGEPSKPARL